MMMLTGRMPVRQGVTVILGCFILFGAPSIAAGIQNAIRLEPDSAPMEVAQNQSASPFPLSQGPKPAPPNPDYDPHSGASLPPR
jgi:hypothetical protein